MVNGHDGQRHAGYESGELFRFFHHAVFDPFAKDAAEGIDQGNGTVGAGNGVRFEALQSAGDFRGEFL